ncbi:hypothetical protein ACP6JD_005432 [Aspergillus fumigatus]
MFFTLLAISGFFRIIRPQEVQKGLVAGFTVVIFTFFYGIGAGSVPFTFSTEVFPLTYREVGMSFSVMVNFLGLSLLVLFVPRLTTILSPNGPSARKARLLGQSNLLFLFREDAVHQTAKKEDRKQTRKTKGRRSLGEDRKFSLNKEVYISV